MADYKFITEQGVIVPDFADTLESVQNEFRNLDGWADIDMSPETPQGAIAVAAAKRDDAIIRNNAYLANQINPNISSGVFLDGLAALTAVERFRATHSILHGVILSGRPNTIISAGAIATDGTEDWRSLNTVILDNTGHATVDFQAVNEGEIKLAPHGLNTVASSILGWTGVDNPSAAIVGKEEEKDVYFKRRRRRTLALQTRGTTLAITSALYNIRGVRSLSWYENYTTAPVIVDGITIRQHALYTCIDGGDADEIAAALFDTKDLGAGFVGDIEVDCFDEYSGQTYPVNFSRPNLVDIAIRITLKPSLLDAVTDVPKLARLVFDGETEASDGLEVGQDFLPYELSAGINELEPRFTITNIEYTQDQGSTWETGTLSVLINELINVLSIQAVIDD